ncbi:unnamed protein product [Polarella glacialis]|uniref:Uncharacterized protein n=1 Tax=Polarella glacialis TaxID=89957 RepID=A0A813KG78_POLGL|nr:unnamed protein product [Polarella glacialis]
MEASHTDMKMKDSQECHPGMPCVAREDPLSASGQAKPASLQPESTAKSRLLQELALWRCGGDGHAWEPPCDPCELQQLNLKALFLWIVKQLRCHREAIGCLAVFLMGGEYSSDGLLQTVADVPARLQTVEDKEQVLSIRLDALRQELLSLQTARTPTSWAMRAQSQAVANRSMTMPGTDPEFAEAEAAKRAVAESEALKETQDSLKEQRHAVSLLHDSLQTLRVEIQESLADNTARLEELRLSATRASDASASDLEARDQRIHGTMKALSSRLSEAEEKVDSMKDMVTSALQEVADLGENVQCDNGSLQDLVARLEMAEASIKGLVIDVEGLAEDRSASGGGETPKGSVKSSPNGSLTVGAADGQAAAAIGRALAEGRAEARAAAEAALASVAALRKELLSSAASSAELLKDDMDCRLEIFEKSILKMTLQKARDQTKDGPIESPPDRSHARAWLNRNPALKPGNLPHLPPSSLALADALSMKAQSPRKAGATRPSVDLTLSPSGWTCFESSFLLAVSCKCFRHWTKHGLS